MKTVVTTFITLLISANNLFAQAPEAFSYQGVALDAKGVPVVSKQIGLRISILQGSSTGTVVLKEAHTPNTDKYGQFSVAIGQGTAVSGTMSAIQWGSYSHFLKAEIDINGGSSYVSAGTSQLLSVPYALYSKKTVDNGYNLKIGENKSDTLSLSDSVNLYESFDGAWNPLIRLPQPKSINNYFDEKVRTTLILSCRSSSSFQILKDNSDLTDNLTLNNGETAVFIFERRRWVMFGSSRIKAVKSGTNKWDTLNIPTNVELYVTGDGSWNSAVRLPSPDSSNSWLRHRRGSTMLLSCRSSFSYRILRDNTEMTNDLVLSTGDYALFIFDGVLWRKIGGKYSTTLIDLAAFSDSLNNTAVGTSSLANKTTAYDNSAFGVNALKSNTTGYDNSAYGYSSLFSNTVGLANTANGVKALFNNITGIANTGIGHMSLYNNVGGNENTAIGRRALYTNTTGDANTAIGVYSLLYNTTGYYNTSSGHYSLFSNTTGYKNTANGKEALRSNTTGNANSANGFYALRNNIDGNGNTASGLASLYLNTSGDYNTATGMGALYVNTLGSNNTSNGNNSLASNKTGNSNTAIGYEAGIANTTGSNNIYIGAFASQTDSNLNNITVIGANSSVSTSNTISIGNGDVTKWVFGIPTTTNPGYAFQVGSTTSNGNGAYLTNGGTWTNASSRDFKENFENIDGTDLLDRIEKMKVQKWSYKGTDEVHVGPVAEEFKSLFNLGVKDDNKHISTLDASGIALRSIQELKKKLDEKDRQMNEKDKQINELKSRLDEMEKLINKILETKK